MRIRIKSILIGGAGLLGLLLIFALVDFYFWRAGIIDELESDPDRRLVSTPLGDIEYAVVGDGIPLLALHGSPGGFDQSLATRRTIPESAIPGVMIIAVSRPGFLATPLESGATYAEQADLFAALLDELGIEKVIISAASAGGLPGLQFALRYPERVLGLILLSAGTMAEPTTTEKAPEYSIFSSLLMDFAIWAVIHLFPSALVQDFDPENDEQANLLNALMSTSVPWSRRWRGNSNEFIQYQDPTIDDWPLESINVPTLIIHGNADRMASYEHALNAAARIPEAELATFEGGDHFITITRREEVDAILSRFVTGLTTSITRNENPD